MSYEYIKRIRKYHEIRGIEKHILKERKVEISVMLIDIKHILRDRLETDSLK